MDRHPDVFSLISFIEWVRKQEARLSELNKRFSLDTDKYELYFRGVDSNRYLSDVPSIFRDEGWIQNEDVLVNECLTRNPHDFLEDKTTFDVLVRMQHYGVPTRLLDITRNPLVALYFATRSKEHKQGKVIAYFISKDSICYPDSPVVALYSNLSRQSHRNWDSEADRDDSWADLIQKARRDIDVSESFYRKVRLEDCYCVKPRMANSRIVRQDGAFLLFGIGTSKRFCHQTLPLDFLLSITRLFAEIYFWGSANWSGDFGNKRFLESAIEEDLLTLRNSESYLSAFRGIKRIYDEKGKNHPGCLLKDFFERLFAILDSEKAHLVNELRRAEWSKEDYRKRGNEILVALSKNKAISEFFRHRGFIASTDVVVRNKSEISSEIEKLGMTNDKLFPELEVRAKSLRELYSSMGGRRFYIG